MRRGHFKPPPLTVQPVNKLDLLQQRPLPTPPMVSPRTAHGRVRRRFSYSKAGHTQAYSGPRTSDTQIKHPRLSNDFIEHHISSDHHVKHNHDVVRRRQNSNLQTRTHITRSTEVRFKSSVSRRSIGIYETGITLRNCESFTELSSPFIVPLPYDKRLRLTQSVWCLLETSRSKVQILLQQHEKGVSDM